MVDGIELSSLPSRSRVPVNQAQLIYILCEISPGAGAPKARMPINFSLVLDRSGSMAGEKLRTMKAAVAHIVDQLSSDDVVSIVTFESNTRVLIPGQPVLNKESLKRQIEGIKDGGGTNLAPALREGLNQVSRSLSEERVNRVVLLTDGEATDPENDSREVADKAGKMGIPLICLGFGQEWKHDFLIDLADRSLMAPGTQTGYADYIPDAGQVDRIFQEVYSSMQVVAKDVALTFRLVQGVEARRVWQVVPMIRDITALTVQDRAIVVPVGELEQGGLAYLLEIILPARPAGLVRAAQAEVTYTLPEGGQQRFAIDAIFEFRSDASPYDLLDTRVMKVVEKVQAFKLQTQALHEAEHGNLSGATQRLRQAVTILLSQGENELASQMQQEAERLEQTGEMSSEAQKTIKLTSRKTVRLSG